MMRKLFRRASILAKLELLSQQSGDNIDFVESQFANPMKASEVINVLIYPSLLGKRQTQTREETNKE